MTEATGTRSLIFVCTGNICRSPLAKVYADQALQQAGMASQFVTDSVGTHAYHQGQAADPRSVQVAQEFQLDLRPHAARRIQPADFQAEFLLVMDHYNLQNLRRMAPPERLGRVKLLMAFAGQPKLEVPDPYTGALDDFRFSFDLIRQGIDGLIKSLQRLHNAGAFD
ncbi:phosphotyrosine protein phosphatase [Ahniella affigens]|uniref:protein-tyrosine-phosphatase n=1 Tax=Ahniella affigens TaxID=2021234 RepID=A0A2P1PPC8_9GAMM|nr:low molecular weight protein-tyrosine-phosphatase [Ahniella affigens]AVP96703.1 phosphotyrosine protein phosphatase [Ahniella affigens]